MRTLCWGIVPASPGSKITDKETQLALQHGQVCADRENKLPGGGFANVIAALAVLSKGTRFMIGFHAILSLTALQ